MKLPYSSEQWPIAAKMSFGPKARNGEPLEKHPEEWRRQLRQVKHLGYTALDPFDVWLPFWDFTNAQAQELLDSLDEYGLVIPSLSMGRKSIVHDRLGDDHLEDAYKYIEFARRCGASIVNIGFFNELTPAQEKAIWFWHEDGHTELSKNRDLAIERTRELADHAGGSDIEISLEMYEDTLIGTPDEAVVFVKDVDRKNVGLNPDLGNLIRLHRPMEDWKSMHSKVLPYSNFWHIKNYFRDFDPATGAYFSFPASLENGLIDYREILDDALYTGFSGPFVTEHYGGDWLTVGARNLRYLRDTLALLMDE